MRIIFRCLILIWALILVGGCAVPTVDQGELRPSSSAEWNTDLIRSHLEFLNSETQEGRARGTRGFLRTADYIADQLKASQVQPFLRGQYKQQYAASVTHLARAEVLFLGSDTLNLVQGEDFFVFPGTDDVQLSPASQELLKDEKYALSRFVEQEERITTSSIHVVGYIPGRDPRSRDSLIVVFAQADGIGAQGAVSYTGGRDAGTGTAALLEVSRRLSTIQDQWSLLGPSVMVSFLSGSRLDCTGLESAMKNFPWQREYILNVIVLDESSHPTCRWEDLSPEIQILRATSTESNEETAPFSPYFLRSELLSDDNMLQLEAESLRLAKLVMASLMAK